MFSAKEIKLTVKLQLFKVYHVYVIDLWLNRCIIVELLFENAKLIK